MVLDRFNEVVRQAQAGEVQAQEELLQILRPYLEQLGRGLATSPRASRSSSDLIQEALLRVWQRLDQFTGHEDDHQSWTMFCAWVGQIMRRLNLNEKRDRGARRRRPTRPIKSLQGERPQGEARGPSIDPPSEDPTASKSAQRNEQVELVKEALDRLGNDPAVVAVRLHFFEALTLKQVAERLQVSYDKARQLFQSGMRQLEQELGPLR